MGIFTSAKLIYGIRYSEIPEDIRDEVDQLIDDGELDYASPYYDSDRDAWVVGVEIDCWGASPEDMKESCVDAYDELPDCLKKLEVAIYVSPDVC